MKILQELGKYIADTIKTSQFLESATRTGPVPRTQNKNWANMFPSKDWIVTKDQAFTVV